MLVVKLGGGEGLDVDAVLDDLAALDEPWILVHGGNAELDRLSRVMGHEPHFYESPSGHTSRRTDAITIGLMQMAYRGRINNDLVMRLQRRGVDAVGLSGVDGAILRAARKEAIIVLEQGRKRVVRDDLTGRIHTVNEALLNLLLVAGHRPVLTPPALADSGEAINVDGDRAAAAIAVALRARALVILSNVPGLLRDIDDPQSVVPRLGSNDWDEGMALAKGRMKRKILGAKEALDGGVPQVILAAAAGPRPIQAALQRKGTVIE